MRAQNGTLIAETRRGTRIEGTYIFDIIRQTFRYDAVAHVPPFFEAITGIVTNQAGRAIDVLMTRVGPPEHWNTHKPEWPPYAAAYETGALN